MFLLLFGGIFAFVGLVFTSISLFFFTHMDVVYANGRGNVEMLPYVFGIIGVLTLLIGIICFFQIVKIQKAKRRLINNGQYVVATIRAVVSDYTIVVNGRPSHKAECVYSDPTTDEEYIFYSDSLLKFRYYDHLVGKTVRVYLDKASRNYEEYFVDIEPLLKKQ